jgi:murein L,D-transpeptidase YcbB/YkuD
VITPIIALIVAAAVPPVTIPNAVETLRHGANLVVAGEPICATHPLPLFYARRDFQPAWSAADEDALLGAIRHAADEGLNPADYHLGALESLGRDGTHYAEIDLLLSDAFFLYASHLLAGRIDPITIEPTWCLEPRTSDLVPALETALENHEVAATLAGMRPSHTGYRQLRDELARYRRMTPWQPIDPGQTLRLGVLDSRVAQLVARLVASGDLEGAHASFDAAVQEAVRRFQRLHGLDDDGVAGARTLRQLNVPLSDRTRQLELNLERWRWLPATLGDRHALINIPQFQLSVIEHGAPVLTMRIVVGKDFEHRTPVFSREIKQIVFSPYWNIPDSIAEKELWPKQTLDRHFFKREHIQVRPNGRLRQTPGPWNALGFIKFELPNPYFVYLHDTPSRDLFAQSVRTFSHGCIRVEKPVDLAHYLLGDDPLWTIDRVVAESRTGIEHTVDVKRPLMVHVLYWTAYVDTDGDLHFAPDIYARDPVLDQAMRKRPPKF